MVDENGTPIQNAYVRATAPVVNAIPDYQGHTGIDGVMRNDSGDDVFEYTMPAVLQITAQKRRQSSRSLRMWLPQIGTRQHRRDEDCGFALHQR